MKHLFVGLLLALLTATNVAQAGVIIGGTRIIFNSDKKETSISVNNPDAVPYLIQSWVDGVGSDKAPFIITPPLFRLDGQQQNILRIVRTGGDFPLDREVLYWANIKAIPTAAKDENVLQVAVKTRLKLIVRPAALDDSSPEEVANQLKWQRQADQLTVTNPTAYYMNFQSITIGGSDISNAGWVAPFSSAHYTLKASHQSSDVEWRLISDFGAIGKVHHAKI